MVQCQIGYFFAFIFRLGALPMRVNIFQATGDEQISKLETEINSWIERTEQSGFSVEIKHCTTAMCQIAYGPEEERLPQLVMTIWYDLARRTAGP